MNSGLLNPNSNVKHCVDRLVTASEHIILCIRTIVYKLSIQDIEEYLVSFNCSFSHVQNKLLLAKIRLSASLQW